MIYSSALPNRKAVIHSNDHEIGLVATIGRWIDKLR